jgi:hypothetical protein
VFISAFNIQRICWRCKEDEKGAPNYLAALAADDAAVKALDYKFTGLQLAVEDIVYLEKCLAARRKKPNGSQGPAKGKSSAA